MHTHSHTHRETHTHILTQFTLLHNVMQRLKALINQCLKKSKANVKVLIKTAKNSPCFLLDHSKNQFRKERKTNASSSPILNNGTKSELGQLRTCPKCTTLNEFPQLSDDTVAMIMWSQSTKFINDNEWVKLITMGVTS